MILFLVMADSAPIFLCSTARPKLLPRYYVNSQVISLVLCHVYCWMNRRLAIAHWKLATESINFPFSCCWLTVCMQALHFEECHGVRVQGVTVQNSQQQHLTFTRCTNARASFLRVSSPESSPATDGIHLVDSKNVQLADNLISTGHSSIIMLKMHLHKRSSSSALFSTFIQVAHIYD